MSGPANARGASPAVADPTRPPINPLLEGAEDYPFVRLAAMRRARVPSGIEPIDFSVGDPRERTPDFIRDALRNAVTEVSSYPATVGLPELRAAAAGWVSRRFGVTVDPDRELLPVNGTKEGVFLLAFAVIGRNLERNVVVIPSPAYPVYAPAAQLAGGVVHWVPLRREDGFRFHPDLVPEEVWRRTALLWLNHPHNPTGATLDKTELAAIAVHARRMGYWVAADEAYADVYFDEVPGSMLQQGTENVIAFHTLSKRSAMTGYRSGFMAGDERLISALARFRPNVGVATPDFVQRAAIAAWNDDAHAERQRAVYRAKRQVMLAAFAERGWKVDASQATFYLWAQAPGGNDVAFIERLMAAGIVATPGSFLGAEGAGYVRWALVPTVERCREAVARLSRLDT
jgi:succinyldiaminopimelate transaminase